MRVGFFGGTFDPPHLGHIALAHAAVERLGLDEVLMAPVAAQPLKSEGARASYADRLAMVRLAIDGDPKLVASAADAQLPDGAPNYTLDTLLRVRSNLTASDKLFCLIGADSLLSLNRWNRAAMLLLFCDWIVAARQGFPLSSIARGSMLPEGVGAIASGHEPGLAWWELAGPDSQRSRLFLLTDFRMDISATAIRAAIAGGENAQTALARPVLAYIRSHSLYRI